MTMPVLRPLTDAEYAAWLAEVIPEYAADKVASGQWSEETALQLAKDEYTELLPLGRATPQNHLLAITDDRARAVGVLWFAVKTRSKAPIAYVYDVGILPEYRRMGHAQRAFAALENEVRRLGLAGIALHVFGHNAGARALYAKLGFRPTNISLFKPVDATRT